MLLINTIRKHPKKLRKNMIRKSTKKTNLTMCRICNKEKGDISIFDNHHHPNISDEIENFSGVIINKTDEYSKHMCQTCLDLLKGCVLFRDLCRASDQRFTELSNRKEAVYIKTEKLCDNTDDFCNVPSPGLSKEDSDFCYCTSCSTSFSDIKSYKDHLDKCTTSSHNITHPCAKVKKKHLCEICGKTATTKASLEAHKSIHDNKFPFSCNQCPYRGRTMDLLRVHRRSHLTVKPYKCEYCPAATTTSSNLAKHIRHVHSTNRPHKCIYCDKAFSSLHDKKVHIRDIHMRQGTVECDICLKKFNTRKILNGHRLKIHKIRGERHGRLPSYLEHQLKTSKTVCDTDSTK